MASERECPKDDEDDEDDRTSARLSASKSDCLKFESNRKEDLGASPFGKSTPRNFQLKTRSIDSRVEIDETTVNFRSIFLASSSSMRSFDPG